jgi:hypothetical protein
LKAVAPAEVYWSKVDFTVSAAVMGTPGVEGSRLEPHALDALGKQVYRTAASHVALQQSTNFVHRNMFFRVSREYA